MKPLKALITKSNIKNAATSYKNEEIWCIASYSDDLDLDDYFLKVRTPDWVDVYVAYRSAIKDNYPIVKEIADDCIFRVVTKKNMSLEEVIKYFMNHDWGKNPISTTIDFEKEVLYGTDK